MNYANRVQGAALSRSLLSVTSKYRFVLLLVFVVLIILSAVLAILSYLRLETKVRELSAFEPIAVMGLSKDLQVGDRISEENLVPMLLYDAEYKDHKESYVLERDKQELIGRVVKVPLLARSFLRQEHLAEVGSLPGLVNLIASKHSLLDLDVPQQGFNVFVRPDDRVDLYEIKDSHSELIAKQVKVILVDSEPLGKAPLRVPVDPRAQRHLSIEIPDAIFERALKAKQAKTLTITYRQKEKTDSPVIVQSVWTKARTIKKSLPDEDLFQALLFIKGPNKELLDK